MLRRFRPPRYARADLTASTTDAIAHGSMVGFGETYIAAFALAIGAGEIYSGMITTLPMLVGGLMQLIAPWGQMVLKSRRRWVVAAAAGQALSFIPLCLGAVWGELPAWILFVAVSCYWGTSLATGPAWNTWIDTLVPARVRACYFAQRTRLAQVSLVFGIVVGGMTLNLFAGSDYLLWAFAAIFIAAAVSRLISAIALSRQREPAPPKRDGRPFHFWQTAGELLGSPAHGLVVFLLLIQASVHISGPFFNAFMLVRLNLSYGEYLILVATAYVAKIAALSFLGGIARRVGVHRLFFFASLGIIPLPLLWLVSPEFHYLAMVQVISGSAWAAYELGMLLLFFDEIPPERRTEWLTVFNLGHVVATAVGSLIGMVLMTVSSASIAGYTAIFVASCLGRLFAVLFFRPRARRAESVAHRPRSYYDHIAKPKVSRSYEPHPRHAMELVTADSSFG